MTKVQTVCLFTSADAFLSVKLSGFKPFVLVLTLIYFFLNLAAEFQPAPQECPERGQGMEGKRRRQRRLFAEPKAPAKGINTLIHNIILYRNKHYLFE